MLSRVIGVAASMIPSEASVAESCKGKSPKLPYSCQNPNSYRTQGPVLRQRVRETVSHTYQLSGSPLDHSSLAIALGLFLYSSLAPLLGPTSTPSGSVSCSLISATLHDVRFAFAKFKFKRR
jgi:hypothetical protein